MGKLFSLIKPWKPSPGEGVVKVHDYRITLYPFIGFGSFGVVCKAFNKRIKLDVAAKGMKLVEGEDELKMMALVEADNMKLISHENIVKLYDVHTHKGMFWLFMEFCDLGDLSKYLPENAHISFDAKLQIMLEVTSAVLYLHKHAPPIIHRDIKPENVLMATIGGIHTAKLTDFGFAKLYDDTVSQCGSKFYTKMNVSLKGTQTYMAPEFFMEDETGLKYTATVDIFSLGLLHAVIMDYGPYNKTTVPMSVTARRNKKFVNFGFEMATAFKGNKALPVIVQESETDGNSIEQLKDLILQMTDFHSTSRCSIDRVHSALASIKEQGAKLRGSTNEGEIRVHEYRITTCPYIGIGAFGVVYKAFNTRTKLDVAAKSIKLEEGADGLKQMALAEAENMKLISHENIVQLYDVHTHKGMFLLFMEFCDRGDLSKYLHDNAHISFDAKLQIMSEVTSAALYLHKHTPPIIHRDIKPENVLMVTVGGIVKAKLTDFGFAKLYDNTLSQIGSKFYTKMNESYKGSPMYMAPEFDMEDESSLKYTATVDIFSLGLLHAVIMDYGPENMTTFPSSVSRRREKTEAIFGREMAMAYKDKAPLPVIVEKDETDDISIEQLKDVILQMTDFHSSNRCSLDRVHRALASIKDIALEKECEMSPNDRRVTGMNTKAPENVVPTPVAEEVPPAGTPAVQKPFEDISQFKNVDSHVLNVSKEEHKSARDLLRRLIDSRCINTEVEKARAIFVLLISKDLTHLHFDIVAKGSCEEMLLNLKKGEDHYAVAFETLCGYAGLECKTIVGFTKAAGYKPGVKVSDGDRHSWNVVFVEGIWRLIDFSLAAGCVSTDDRMRCDIHDVYFMPDPNQLILTHFPDNPRWQLLNPPITKDDFENLVRVWSSFYKFGLEMMSHRHVVIQAEAEVTVHIAYPPVQKDKLDFTFRFQNEEDEETQEADNQADLCQYGMHEKEGNEAVFIIRPPKIGRYCFTIFAKDANESQYHSVYMCEYTLVCDVQPSNAVPFPPCTQSHWGPRPSFYEYNLISIQHGAKIRTVQGQAEVIFSVPTGLRLRAILKSHKMDKNDLERYIIQRKVADVVIFTFYGPTQGEYGLEIYAGDPDKDGSTLKHVCQYLITCSESVSPAEPFPVLALGPKPLCVTLGLASASHIDPFIQSAQGEDVIELDMEKPLRMTSKLVYVSKDQNINCTEYVLQQSRGYKVFFHLKLPKAGMYTFQLYGIEHNATKLTLPEVFNYLIHCKTAALSPVLYPKQFRYWSGCYLYSPKEGLLTPSIPDENLSSSQDSIFFKIDVPEAHSVDVLVGDDWTELVQTNPAGIWEGNVPMSQHWGNQTKATVLANFDSDGSRYKILLEYMM